MAYFNECKVSFIKDIHQKDVYFPYLSHSNSPSPGIGHPLYSKHLNRRDTHINQHSRQKMIQIKRETHVLINTAQKTVHNNLQHALNNRDTPNLATCLFYKDLEKNTTFLT